jgi:NitT/TauT family transport system permease protein
LKGNARIFWGLLVVVLVLTGVTQIFEWEGPGGSGLPSPEIGDLPLFTVHSLVRILAAYALALVFSLPYGYYAAVRPRAGKVLLPILDILQSIPVLGFFPAAVYFFIALAGGSRLGIEMASVFLIFTSQAWNMAFGVYESCSTVPEDLKDAARSLGLGPGATYRSLYFPASIPRLVYNSMLSWAGGWYFLIACEIITVGPVTYNLPGLGYFLARTTEEGRLGHTFAGIAVLLFLIVLVDILFWRPLTVWSTQFRYEMAVSSVERTIGAVRKPLRGGRLAREVRILARRGASRAWRVVRHGAAAAGRWAGRRPFPRRLGRTLWRLFGVAVVLGFGAAVAWAAFSVVKVLVGPWPREARDLPLAMLYSTLRMLAAYLISLAWTVPVAVWAGNSRRVMQFVRPLAQIGASLPATALFPLMVYLVIQYAGGMNVASVLLILTGMQWYLLFNLLSGVDGIPRELKEATLSLGLTRWQTFRSLTFPAILPALITGSVTGWGGGWNALIVSEYFKYAHEIHTVTGIGAALDRATYELGDMRLMVLALLTMVTGIVLMNHFFWRRLYTFASERFRVEL